MADDFGYLDDMFQSKPKKESKKKKKKDPPKLKIIEEKNEDKPEIVQKMMDDMPLLYPDAPQGILLYPDASHRTKEPEKPKKKKKKKKKKRTINDVDRALMDHVTINRNGRIYITDLGLFDVLPLIAKTITNEIMSQRFCDAVSKVNSSYGDSTYKKRISKTHYETLISIASSIDASKMKPEEREALTLALKECRDIDIIIAYKTKESINSNERGDVAYVDEF